LASTEGMQIKFSIPIEVTTAFIISFFVVVSVLSYGEYRRKTFWRIESRITTPLQVQYYSIPPLVHEKAREIERYAWINGKMTESDSQWLAGYYKMFPLMKDFIRKSMWDGFGYDKYTVTLP